MTMPLTGTAASPVMIDDGNENENIGVIAAAAMKTTATATTKPTNIKPSDGNAENDGNTTPTPTPTTAPINNDTISDAAAAANNVTATATAGTSIDTFTEYQPTSLPNKVIRACNEWYNATPPTNSKSTAAAAAAATASSPSSSDVIDLVDDNDEDKVEEDNNDDNGEGPYQLHVPSHTSSACESALLSSVVAPLVTTETAECILPLLLERSSSLDCNNGARSYHHHRPPPPPLSPLQLEGVLLSIQRHRRIQYRTNIEESSQAGRVQKYKGVRAGFFLGTQAVLSLSVPRCCIIFSNCMPSPPHHCSTLSLLCCSHSVILHHHHCILLMLSHNKIIASLLPYPTPI